MARFRTRLKQLMLDKSAKLGEQLSQRDLAEQSGISLATVSRLYTREFDRIDADTLSSLLTYFDCKFEDLIEIVPD